SSSVFSDGAFADGAAPAYRFVGGSRRGVQRRALTARHLPFPGSYRGESGTHSWILVPYWRRASLDSRRPPSPRWGPTGLHRTQNKKYKHFQRDKRKISLSFQGGQRGSRRPYDEARLADLGGVALPGSPAEFGKLIAEDTEKWGKVIPAANIKPQV